MLKKCCLATGHQNPSIPTMSIFWRSWCFIYILCIFKHDGVQLNFHVRWCWLTVTTGSLVEHELWTLSEHTSSLVFFSKVCVARSLDVHVVYMLLTLLVCLSFCLSPCLCLCLSFSLRLLISTLVSANFSCKSSCSVAFSKQQSLFYVLYLGRVVCLIRHTNISPFWRVEQNKWKNVCYLYISYFHRRYCTYCSVDIVV